MQQNTNNSKRKGTSRMGVGLATALLALPLLAVAPLAASAAEAESSMARGGRLYDKWYKVIDAEAPKQPHAAYPSDKKYAAKPKANWRCKECHGWDYMGKDGAYSKGKHHSGIVGVRAAQGADAAAVVASLKGEPHGYAGMMDDADFQDLANFVVAGQVDMDALIDRASKKPKGAGDRGEAYYHTLCANCHGANGTEIDDMPPMGKLSNDNPWETLHKILNGQPDEKMPALRALDMQVSIDILAYVQTLPAKK